MISVGFKNLRIPCIIGVYDDERVREQPVFADLEVRGLFEPATEEDALDGTVDYDTLVAVCRGLLREHRYHLLETAARAIGTTVLARFPRADSVHLEIRKPSAIPQADCAFVRIAMSRGDL